MRQLGLAICVAPLLSAATGENACLDYTVGNNQFRCSAGKIINLAGCGITDSDAQDLGTCFENAGQDSLEIIYLNDNGISILPTTTFQGLGALQVLYLNDNDLSILPATTFQGLGALRALYLGDNPFTDLDGSLFDGLASLQRLWINGCPLTTLPVGIFDELTSLEQLSLHNNELGSLPAGLFGDGLETLHHVDLRENALVTLPAESFQKLEALSTLNLSENRISALSPGNFPEKLEYLYLADNDLGQGSIDPGAFGGLGKLLSLTLSNNELGTLPAGLFRDLESLTVLGLAGNSGLQCVPSTAGSPSLLEEKIILPLGFAVGGVCLCPRSEVCDDCIDGELGYTCTGCGEKASECQLDRTCQECRIPPNDQEQAGWDACIARYDFRATCSALSATACCFDELSGNDCMQNDAFVAYATCRVKSVSENECTTLSCLETESATFSQEQEAEETSGGVRFKNPLVGWAVGPVVAGLASFAAVFA